MRTVKGRCVFLNYDERGGCVLQKYARINKLKYKLKRKAAGASHLTWSGKQAGDL